MVDPKVPSFWPHNEVTFHRLNLPNIYDINEARTKCAKFSRFIIPIFRHGRHTRPGWTLLRMRSTKKSTRIEETASYWSKHLVLQMHLELVTWCRVVEGYI